jgi:putative RecB family exonuclease
MGGFAVSSRLSPSRLATYLTCPRQYEYDYEHDLEVDRTLDTERYLNRGSVLDTTLQTVADEVTPATDPGTIQQLAQEAFIKHWAETTHPRDYPSSGAYEYDRRVSAAAIDDYLDPGTDGAGVQHLQHSVGTEVHLEWDDEEFGRLHGYADNVVETDDGLLLIDYKASSGSLPNKNGNDLTSQLNGEKHYPRRLKKWLQIALYWQGLTHHELYSRGDTIEFLFYGLIDKRERTVTADGYTVAVSGKPWEMTDLYRAQADDFEKLVQTAITGLRDGAYDPRGEQWELIQENACDDCSYQTACGDYLAEEVRFS